MEGEKEIKDPQESKGFGGGMIAGIVVGIILFLLTVQVLHMAR
jgi:hypothetical protein